MREGERERGRGGEGDERWGEDLKIFDNLKKSDTKARKVR
jgi:hypothetical protein